MAEVVTGDAVVLEVTAAAFPARMVGRFIDMAIQIVLLYVAVVIIVATAGHLSVAALVAIATVAAVLVIVGYPTIFETLSRGKTLGKMVMGLRVVSDDGGPIRFRQALIRALAGIFEIWTIVLAPVALITSLASAKGKRLGDMFAGTYAILERAPRRKSMPPEFAVVPPPLAAWASSLELSGLRDRDAEAASSYLRRFYDLQPAAREALGLQLAAAISASVGPPPPPGTPPAAYLAAVIAIRRHREHARLTAQQTAVTGSSTDATLAAMPPLAPPPPVPGGQVPPAAP